MESSRELASMDAVQLRNLTATLLAQLTERDAALSAKDAQLANRDQELRAKQLKIDQLTHEMAILKRWHFDRRSEQMDPMQRSRQSSLAGRSITSLRIPMRLRLWARAHRRGCER